MAAVKYGWQEFILDAGKLPNWFTFLRIFGFLFFLLPLLLNDNLKTAFVVFILLAATDFIDGYLARRNNLITWLGKGLDPAADKILIVGTLFAMGFFNVYPLLGAVLVVFESILFEIGIMVFLSKNEKYALGANIFGKVKAIFEIVVIVLLFINNTRIFYVHIDIILLIFWAAVVFAIMSILSHLGWLRGILPEGDTVS